MRGKRAKEIRRSVYGDQSQREQRVYMQAPHGTIYTSGLRARYLDAKDAVKRVKHGVA